MHADKLLNDRTINPLLHNFHLSILDCLVIENVFNSVLLTSH
jgi:hypothetical protein